MRGPVVPEGLLAGVSPPFLILLLGTFPSSQDHSMVGEVDPVFALVLLRDRTPFHTHTISMGKELLIPSSNLLQHLVRGEERVVPVRRAQITSGPWLSAVE